MADPKKPDEKPAAATPPAVAPASGAADAADARPAVASASPPTDTVTDDPNAVDALATDAPEDAGHEDGGKGRAPRCPECRVRLDRYAGANPHKMGTMRCPEHGRVRL